MKPNDLLKLSGQARQVVGKGQGLKLGGTQQIAGGRTRSVVAALNDKRPWVMLAKGRSIYPAS
jgi:hypothetical protein